MERGPVCYRSRYRRDDHSWSCDFHDLSIWNQRNRENDWLNYWDLFYLSSHPDSKRDKYGKQVAMKPLKYCKRLEDLLISDTDLAGGKNASLGEMLQTLSKKGVHVPSGFAITTDGYRLFIEENHLKDKIDSALKELSSSSKSLQKVGKKVRKYILSGKFSSALEEEIYALFDGMGSVAVRSSATAEDLPDASFAG